MGMASCGGGGFTQAQVDMAAKRAGEIAAHQAHQETKKRLTAVYVKLGAKQAEAEAMAELDAQAAADAAYKLADDAIRKSMPVAPPAPAGGGGLGAILMGVATIALQVAGSAAQAKWGNSGGGQ
jgi:hypothetical protein